MAYNYLREWIVALEQAASRIRTEVDPILFRDYQSCLKSCDLEQLQVPQPDSLPCGFHTLRCEQLGTSKACSVGSGLASGSVVSDGGFSPTLNICALPASVTALNLGSSPRPESYLAAFLIGFFQSGGEKRHGAGEKASFGIL